MVEDHLVPHPTIYTLRTLSRTLTIGGAPLEVRGIRQHGAWIWTNPWVSGAENYSRRIFILVA
jgi:hypothetical protein